MPLVGGLVAFVLCLSAFAAIAEVTRQPGVPPIDRSMTTLLRGLASPSLDTLMSGLTGFGSTLVLAALSGLAVVVLAARRHRTKALFVTVALVGSLVLNDALKLLVRRPRPALDWAEIRPEYAFPSGHAMSSLVVYVALALIAWQLWGRRTGIMAMALSLILATGIGASRVYLGVHWLTDVVGGFLAGVLWLLIVVAVFAAGRWRRRRNARPPPASATDSPARGRS